MGKGTENRKRKSPSGRLLLRGSFLLSMAILSIASFGYSGWIVSGSGDVGVTGLDVDAASVEEKLIKLFSVGTSSGDALLYHYSSSGSSSANGLINDGAIGNVGNETFRLIFDMATFRANFSWSAIDFTITLAYASGVTSLSLINSNISASLQTSTTTYTSTTSSSTTSAKDATFTKVSADSSSAVYSTSYANPSNTTFNYLNFIMTYTFTVSDGASEAAALSSLSSSAFCVKASVSERSAS